MNMSPIIRITFMLIVLIILQQNTNGKSKYGAGPILPNMDIPIMIFDKRDTSKQVAYKMKRIMEYNKKYLIHNWPYFRELFAKIEKVEKLHKKKNVSMADDSNHIIKFVGARNIHISVPLEEIKYFFMPNGTIKQPLKKKNFNYTHSRKFNANKRKRRLGFEQY